MNLNKIYKPQPKFTQNNDICKRGKVDTGTTCNYNCYFCYYKNSIHSPFKPFEDIKQDIDKLVKQGIEELDFSGGESSIHPNFFEILDYSSSLSQISNLSMLSNGWFGDNEKFIKKLKEHKINEILFSLHGWNSITHNKKVGKIGAFEKILKSINICNKLNIETRINCSIDNDFEQYEYYELIKNMNISQINFLPLNYWEDASTLHVLNYHILEKKLQYIIKKLKELEKNIDINVRYFPYCYSNGFEDNQVNIYQHIFDKKDWNIQSYDKNNKILISKENMFKIAEKNRNLFYFKPLKCKECKYLYICDGIKNEIKDYISIKPIFGEKIKDILYLKKIKYL